jgi:hypothetical protein
MEIIPVLPRTPPIVPAWLPECEGVGGVVEDALEEEALTEYPPAEYALVEFAHAGDVLAEDVYTPEEPRIAPGPYSGPSISNVGVRL